MGALRWATPTREDSAAWQELMAAMEAVDEHGEVYTIDDVDDQWSSVWSDPERCAVFVWDGDDLVAFSWLKVMPGRRESHKAILWGGVRPSHRRRGIGTELLRWQMERATAATRDLDPAFAVVLNLDALPHETDLLALATAVGFTPARTFLEVARATARPVDPFEVPAGATITPFTPELDEPTRLAHTDAFADHWGSEPRSPEEWRQWFTGHRGFRPDLSRVAVDGATGDVAGYVLLAAYPADWDLVPVEAWVNTVGTVRSWRGRGLGRALMSAVLEAVADADDGFERAMLGVDAENPSGAVALYRSLGFEDVRALTTLARGPLA